MIVECLKLRVDYFLHGVDHSVVWYTWKEVDRSSLGYLDDSDAEGV